MILVGISEMNGESATGSKGDVLPNGKVSLNGDVLSKFEAAKSEMMNSFVRLQQCTRSLSNFLKGNSVYIQIFEVLLLLLMLSSL